MLKLEKNIYGQNQASCVWNSFIVDKLLSIEFTTSLIDDCVFFPDDIIFMVYVDDRIFLGNNDSKLQEAIKDIQNLGLNIEDQGHPADYGGVNIKKLCDGSYEFTKCALIDSIINDVELKYAKVKPVPAKESLQLHAFKDKPPFNLDFNYRSAVDKLNYLAQTRRPDIMYVIHQMAKYSFNPRQSHGKAVLYLVCYLKKHVTLDSNSDLILRKVLSVTVMPFLWKLEEGICSSGPQYCQVTKWMDNLLCRMPCLMGVQTSVTSCTFNHSSQVYPYHVTISL